MKKVLALLLLFVLVCSLTACGTENAQPDLSSPAGTPVPTEVTESVGRTIPETSRQEETVAMDEASEQQTEPVENMEAPVQMAEADEQVKPEENAQMKMQVQIGDSIFTATLEDNEAVSELVAMMQEAPVVIAMHDYSGFEKVGPLGRSLTANNSQTTTQAGDIVLYNGNQIVMFYGENSWSYTRIGYIDDLTGWEEALGNGDVTVSFSLA